MIWLLACSTPCPEGTRDAERLSRLQALAPSIGDACFGERSGLVGDTVVLDASASDPDLAARALHLGRHARTAQPKPGPSCEADWLAFEVDGWRAELVQRRAMSLEAELPFEADWRVSQDDDVVRRWLVDNPEGGGGVDALMSGYSARCMP